MAKSGLTQGIRRAVQIRPHGVAVIDGALRYSWPEFADRVARCAGLLRTAGVGEGDRVALLALNSHRSIELFFGALHAGAVIMPLNHRLAAEEIAAQVADARPSVLVIDRAFADQIDGLKQAADSIKSVFIGDAADGDSLPVGTMAYGATLDAADPIDDAGRGDDDLACLFYTSGTTSAAKGVMLSHANIIANTANVVRELEMDDQTVHLHHGPLFHVAAGVRLFSVTHMAGTHVVLPRFVAGEVIAEMARTRVTHATFVPTMLRSMLDDPLLDTADMSAMRFISYGSAPMPEALLKEVMGRLPHVRFMQSYGMTELSPVATILGWRDHLPESWSSGRLRSAGRAAMLCDVAVVGPDDMPLPLGERGEVVVRGPNVMQGYWGRADLTDAAIRDGWMHTGDVGYFDADGYLYVVDRLKDMIITGGENVYSQEVENCIAAHPAVSQCAVFGRPHPHWGEAVHAVVLPRADMDVTAADIIAHCRAHIAHYKCPRTVEIRTEPMPLSGANKIQKAQLRAELLAREPVAD